MKTKEKIVIVKNHVGLKEINELLSKIEGSRVKFIQPIAESMTGNSGCAIEGNIYAYIVLELPVE